MHNVRIFAKLVKFVQVVRIFGKNHRNVRIFAQNEVKCGYICTKSRKSGVYLHKTQEKVVYLHKSLKKHQISSYICEKCVKFGEKHNILWVLGGVGVKFLEIPPIFVREIVTFREIVDGRGWGGSCYICANREFCAVS